MAPSGSNVVFEKDVIFHEFDFETSDWIWGLEHWKHTTSCGMGVFTCIIRLQLRQTIELKLLLLYAYVVFDNYQ